MVVTRRGAEVLTARAPKEPDEIEAVMAAAEARERAHPPVHEFDVAIVGGGMVGRKSARSRSRGTGRARGADRGACPLEPPSRALMSAPPRSAMPAGASSRRSGVWERHARAGGADPRHPRVGGRALRLSRVSMPQRAGHRCLRLRRRQPGHSARRSGARSQPAAGAHAARAGAAERRRRSSADAVHADAVDAAGRRRGGARARWWWRRTARTRSCAALPASRPHVEDYGQVAVVVNVGADSPQSGIAYRALHAAGPLAVLPLARRQLHGDLGVRTRARAASCWRSSEPRFSPSCRRSFGWRVGRFVRRRAPRLLSAHADPRRGRGAAHGADRQRGAGAASGGGPGLQSGAARCGHAGGADRRGAGGSRRCGAARARSPTGARATAAASSASPTDS